MERRGFATIACQPCQYGPLGPGAGWGAPLGSCSSPFPAVGILRCVCHLAWFRTTVSWCAHSPASCTQAKGAGPPGSSAHMDGLPIPLLTPVPVRRHTSGLPCVCARAVSQGLAAGMRALAVRDDRSGQQKGILHAVIEQVGSERRRDAVLFVAVVHQTRNPRRGASPPSLWVCIATTCRLNCRQEHVRRCLVVYGSGLLAHGPMPEPTSTHSLLALLGCAHTRHAAPRPRNL